MSDFELYLENPAPPFIVEINEGVSGIGIPAGGNSGEVLTKASNADYDTIWAAGGGGGGGSGTVTSVALSLPSIFSVTGSPITVSGTLSASLISQSANTFFAAPNGSSGVPSFRSIVAADIPALPYVSSALTSAHIFVGNASNVATSVAMSGDATLSNTGALTIANDAVTFAKMQNISFNHLIGRHNAGSGDPQQITIDGGLELSGASLRRSAFTGDVTASAGSGSLTIANNAVTFSKFQDISTQIILGRHAAGTGVVQEVSIGGGLEWSSSSIRREALTGDVTASAGSNTTTIANSAVTYAKIQNVANQRILGRNTAGSGVVEELTSSQVLDWLGSTRGQILYRGASGWTVLSAGTSGQLLQTNGAGADPSWVTASGGGGITSLNSQTGASQTFTNDTNVTISSSSNVHTLGWSGTLSNTRGGTGTGTYATGDILYASASNTLSKLSIGSSGEVLTVSGGVPVWQGVSGTGTVTSVALSLPSIFSVTGSPITSSGTLTATLASQSANLVFASPDGSSGTPTFRSLVAADIPSLPYASSTLTSGDIFVGNASNVATAVTMSGDATISNTGSLTIANNAVSNAKFRQSGSMSVVGRSANSTGAVADISASTNHHVLRRSGTTLGFGSLDLSQSGTVGTSRLAYSNIAQGSGLSVLGVTGASTANVASIAGTADQVLRVNGAGTALAFGQIATGGITNSAVTYAKIQDVANQRILARNTAGSGVVEETTISQTLDWIGSTQGQILFRGASGWSVLSAGTSGQLLQTNGAGSDPSWATVSGGGGISSLNSQTGATQTFSNDTNVTISSATNTHTLGWSGTLANSRGGTGTGTYTTGDILYASATNTLSKLGIGASGEVLTVSGGVPSWQAVSGTGTVTSVALSMPSIFSVSGSPVTTSGTLTATLASQSANTVFAAPNGSAGAPTFRALVAGDIPSLPYISTTLTSANIIVGNGSNVATAVSLSGDATISNAGALTIANSAVTFAKFQDINSQRILGRNSAGVGLTEELQISQALDWIGSTQGQILYRGAAGWEVLGTGTSGQYLQTQGAGFNPVWAAASGGALSHFSENRSTTTPNATIPAHELIAIGSEANIDAVFRPKGNGAILAITPDNSTTGGNKRGTNAVDWQLTRSAASQVASGARSVVSGGTRNTCLGAESAVVGGYQNNISTGSDWNVAGGYNNTISASCFSSAVFGESTTISGTGSHLVGGQGQSVSGVGNLVGGRNNTLNASYSSASGYHANGGSTWTYVRLHGQARYSRNGDNQRGDIVLYRSITGTSTAELFTNGASQRFVLQQNSAMTFTVKCTAITSTVGNGTGTLGDTYGIIFCGVIKRIVNDTVLVGTIQTVMTGQGNTGMSGAAFTVTADNTNESLKVEFTPPSSAGSTTVTRANAQIEFNEVGY
jgi:hypothetical protein